MALLSLIIMIGELISQIARIITKYWKNR